MYLHSHPYGHACRDPPGLATETELTFVEWLRRKGARANTLGATRGEVRTVGHEGLHAYD